MKNGFRPLTGLSLYLRSWVTINNAPLNCFRPLTGLSLYLLFHFFDRCCGFFFVSVPSRGYLYIYTIPPFPLKTWPKVPLCGAKRHFRNFHSARQSFFFISPGNMPCGAKLPFYYFNSAHSHIIQLPLISRTFAYMRRQS